MPLMDVLNVLRQYSTATAANPPANAQQDFEKVAQAAPREHLADGLAEAFRSNQTPAFPEMLANLFSQSNGQQRAGILSQLLGSVNPGAMAGLGGGLAALLRSGSAVSPEQASQISPAEVQQLAEHAQRNNPSVIEQASSFYSQHPKLVQALGGGALAVVMSHMSKRA
jgi:hypothetical protein